MFEVKTPSATKMLSLENVHLDIATNTMGALVSEENPDLLKNPRFKAHFLLWKHFPEYFPKFVITDRHQRLGILKEIVRKRLEPLSLHEKRLDNATADQLYGVEAFTLPTWDKVMLKLTADQHVAVAIEVLNQLYKVFMRTGVLLADRNPGNVFIDPNTLKVKQSDFGIVKDIFSENIREVDLSINRETAKPLHTQEMVKEIQKVIDYILKLVTRYSKYAPNGGEQFSKNIRTITTWLSLVDTETMTPNSLFEEVMQRLKEL
jgi:hypothetical protein